MQWKLISFNKVNTCKTRKLQNIEKKETEVMCLILANPAVPDHSSSSAPSKSAHELIKDISPP